MAETRLRDASAPRLTRSGILRLITVVLHAVVLAAIFFAAAGTVHVPRAWIYYGGTLAYLVAAMAVIFLFFPGAVEIVNERGRFQKGVKGWDKVFGVLYTVILLLQPAVAGLDVGRFRWSEAPAFLFVPALAVTLLAYLLVHWAMVVNRHAETGVRIQEDRGHEVVSSGPYRFVRHPFYVSIIATQLVYPLALGSLAAYGPALAVTLLLVWRTGREDRTLRAELPGYADYAARVRYRLLPGVW